MNDACHSPPPLVGDVVLAHRTPDLSPLLTRTATTQAEAEDAEATKATVVATEQQLESKATSLETHVDSELAAAEAHADGEAEKELVEEVRVLYARSVLAPLPRSSPPSLPFALPPSSPPSLPISLPPSLLPSLRRLTSRYLPSACRTPSAQVRNDARDVAVTKSDVTAVEKGAATLVDDVMKDASESAEEKKKVVDSLEKVVATVTEEEGAVETKLANVRPCVCSLPPLLYSRRFPPARPSWPLTLSPPHPLRTHPAGHPGHAGDCDRYGLKRVVGAGQRREHGDERRERGFGALRE